MAPLPSPAPESKCEEASVLTVKLGKERRHLGRVEVEARLVHDFGELGCRHGLGAIDVGDAKLAGDAGARSGSKIAKSPTDANEDALGIAPLESGPQRANGERGV